MYVAVSGCDLLQSQPAPNLIETGNRDPGAVCTAMGHESDFDWNPATGVSTVALGNGQRIDVVWPSGYRGELQDGVLTVFAADGRDVVTDGERLFHGICVTADGRTVLTEPRRPNP